MAEWIPAPTSGVLHVAGDGYPRRECRDGVRLLCGWVLTAKKAKDLSRLNDERIGQKCKACSAWLAKNGEENK